MDESTLEDEHSISKEESSLLAFMQQIEDNFVPGISSGFDEPISDSNFSTYTEFCDKKFQVITELIENDLQSVSTQLKNKYRKKCLAAVVILCGQHSSENKWTTKNSVEVSVKILNASLKLFGYSTIAEALSSENCTLLKYTLNKMRPWLLKDSWKNYPAIPNCYYLVLCKIKSPNLSDHLDAVLPTALILTDDFVMEYRLIGLKSLEHIINNVTMTQLSWSGQNNVILKALEPLFYEKDVDLIPSVTQTFVALLKKQHLLKIYESKFLQMNEFDSLIDKFIHNMMFEEKLNLRSAYINALPKIILARGLGIMFHSSSLIEMFTEYVLEPTSSVEALCVLESFIDLCWLRMSTHCNTFLLLISKCALGLQARGYPPECENQLRTIFMKLKNLCPEKVKIFMDDLTDEDSLGELQEFFN